MPGLKDAATGKPIAQEGTSGAAHVLLTSLIAGENQTADQLSAGQIWKRQRITASGAVAGIGAGNVFGGLMYQVAGTSTTITVHDDTVGTDATKLLIPTTAALAAVGYFINPFGGAIATDTIQPQAMAGLLLDTGLYVTIGGTGSPAFWVLYR